MPTLSAVPLPVADSPEISALVLRRALIAGARRVIADRDTLNRINVFPVADGDTGNNLAFTLQAVLAGALSQRARSVGELLNRVGAQAVDGARGNSGAILAQFFQGMSESVGGAERLDAMLLARAVRAGADSARQALSEPREGTVLSVIRAFAEALDAKRVGLGLQAAFEYALQRSREALAATTGQLAVLQKAGVVDAGARGFVDLLEGIAEFIQDGRSTAPAETADTASLAVAAHTDAIDNEHPDHRWCSECLVSADALDRIALRRAVEALGASCVVLAGSSTRARLHAHVADAQALFDACARFGQLEGCKADDMFAQQRHTGLHQEVAIITDSSADLPPGLAEQLNVDVVPLRINFGERDYLDRVSLMPREFFQRVRAGGVLPRTSQPPVGDFRRQFEFLLAHHPQVLYVGLSRAVSGTLQAAESAAAKLGSERVQVFDTAQAAGGQGLLVMAAAELAAAGETRERIVAELQRLKPLTLTWAAARDVKHAVRGGRVPRWIGPIAEWFGLTPIAHVTHEGRLKVSGALFGSQDVPARMAAYVAKRTPAGQQWRLIVGHGDSPEDGQALLEGLRARLDCTQSWLVDTGPAVGAHAGPGTLVVSLQPIRPD